MDCAVLVLIAEIPVQGLPQARWGVRGSAKGSVYFPFFQPFLLVLAEPLMLLFVREVLAKPLTLQITRRFAMGMATCVGAQRTWFGTISRLVRLAWTRIALERVWESNREIHAMRLWLLAGMAALLPMLWGWAVHWFVARFWPEGQDHGSSQANSSSVGSSPLDYQI